METKKTRVRRPSKAQIQQEMADLPVIDEKVIITEPKELDPREAQIISKVVKATPTSHTKEEKAMVKLTLAEQLAKATGVPVPETVTTTNEIKKKEETVKQNKVLRDKQVFNLQKTNKAGIPILDEKSRPFSAPKEQSIVLRNKQVSDLQEGLKDWVPTITTNHVSNNVREEQVKDLHDKQNSVLREKNMDSKTEKVPVVFWTEGDPESKVSQMYLPLFRVLTTDEVVEDIRKRTTGTLNIPFVQKGDLTLWGCQKDRFWPDGKEWTTSAIVKAGHLCCYAAVNTYEDKTCDGGCVNGRLIKTCDCNEGWVNEYTPCEKCGAKGSSNYPCSKCHGTGTMKWRSTKSNGVFIWVKEGVVKIGNLRAVEADFANVLVGEAAHNLKA